MGMKKIAVAALAVFVSLGATISVAPAQASNKSLVIVDSYFDSRIGDTPIECISGSLCGKVGKANRSLTAEVNHGVAMVDAVKSSFPGVPLIALQASSATAPMNVGHLIASLEWALANKDKVAALSVSRKMNGTKHKKTGCDAAATNTAAWGGSAKADLRVRELISLLKLENIPVFVSTGNVRNSKLVDYPACIIETESVSTGVLNSSGGLISNHTFNDQTDYFVSLSNDRFSIKGNVFSLIPNTTSTATALTAAKYVMESMLDKMIVVD